MFCQPLNLCPLHNPRFIVQIFGKWDMKVITYQCINFKV
nr:MAG TPA: hypothetical protein [Bacteriophage sp.]DAP67935.1 MAG TPA: hypothetical protein [Caudoviricetes sp.]